MAETPTPEEIRKWHRWFAVETNNRAWDLAALTTRSALEDEEMRNAAYSAKYHWSQAGTELNTARADGLLGQVLALLGQGAEAMRYAESNFRYIATHESPDWEIAFAHAILANAAAAKGETATFREHDGIAEKLGNALGADDKGVFDTIFRRVPCP